MMMLLWITLFLVIGGTLLAPRASLRAISCALWLVGFGVAFAALVVAVVTTTHSDARIDGILGVCVSVCFLLFLPLLLRLFGFPEVVYLAITARRRRRPPSERVP